MTTPLGKAALTTVLTLWVFATPHATFGQGRGGGRAGGGRPGGGEGGMSRPAAAPHSPSFNAPRQPQGQGAGQLQRPNLGGGGENVNRPQGGERPTTRPAPAPQPAQRPAGLENRPGAGNRPGQGNPGIGERPGGGERPGLGNVGQGNRPGGTERPGLGNVGQGNRPGGTERPGLGNVGQGNRPGGTERPGINNPGNGNRPGLGNGGMANRPGAAGTGGGGNRPIVNNPNVNRPINGGNNINSGNRTNNGGNTVINNNVTNVNNTSNRVNANNFNNSRNVNNFGNAGGGGYGYGNGGNNWPGRSNYAGYHSDWAHGSWNNHYPNYNTSNWGSFGVGFVSGAATWGLGSSLSNWGYSSYSNPYYYAQPVIVQQPTTVVVAQPAAPAAVVYDYTQPINVYSAPPEQSVAEQAVAQMDAGREAFKAGDYSTALNQTDHAIEKMPNDPSLHEFRALVLFAIGQYDAAASALYPVLSAGPGWDWTTMIGLYPNVDVYTQQLNDLKADIKNRPNTAQGHFLLAYHYLTQGYPDNARAELREVVRLQPGDTLSAKLLSQLSPPPANSAAPPNPTPAAPVAADEVANPPATPDAQGASLVGSWTASPNPDTKIILTLGDTGAFSWKVSQKSVTNELTGDSTFVNGILTLAPKEGSGDPLVGKVKTGDDGTFNFKAAGAPPDDPGLTFGKNPG